MTSNPGTSSSESVSSSQSTDKAPLWDYVTRVSKAVEKGGTWKFTCNFCEETKQGSYSRVRAHLLQISKQGIATCKRVTPTALIEMKNKEKEYEDAKSNSAPKDVPLPCRGPDLENTFKKRKESSSPLVRAFDVDTRTQLDQEIAQYFLCDPHRRPIINFMATSENGPMFIKAINCMGEFKSKEFIANLMKEVIYETGHQNVVQIITNNAANCKGAGEIIEGLYPEIYWTPCVVHTLALKNICAAKNTESNFEVYDECHWITEVYGDAMHVKNFIMNHTMRLSMYNKFSSLKLLSVADTRFASTIVMLKRFYSDDWLSEDPLRVPPHKDGEISHERMKCFRRL
ncbi:hAT dimerization domain, ribonuclease H-like domain protein [Tanacetum coccineum]